MWFETIPASELDLFVTEERGIIIDLRPREEYALRHIRGAQNLSYEELEQYLEQTAEQGGTVCLPLPKDEELILYCERGAVSMAAARELADLGYRVRSVVGGIRAYRGKYLVTGKSE